MNHNEYEYDDHNTIHDIIYKQQKFNKDLIAENAFLKGSVDGLNSQIDVLFKCIAELTKKVYEKEDEEKQGLFP
jgi:hypothetical protein